jgi:RNA polymerase-binding protein DksA
MMNQNEMRQFRNKLLSFRERVRGEIHASIEAIVEEVHVPGEDSKEPSEGLDKELALEHNEEDIYHAINAALERIEEGNFGRCAECGKPIPKTRLNALPWTAYCIKCERQIEQERGQPD